MKLKSRIHLCATPSFLTGIARLLDPFNRLDEHRQSAEGPESDYHALLSDWSSIGDDIEQATLEYALNHLKQDLRHAEGPESDYHALLSDWSSISDDIEQAALEYALNHDEALANIGAAIDLHIEGTTAPNKQVPDGTPNIQI